MSVLEWTGWGKSQNIAYSHRIGQDSTWTVSTGGGGIIGGDSVLVANFTVPTVYNNKPITEYGQIGIKIAGLSTTDISDFKAYLFNSAPSNDIPSEWRGRINNKTGIVASSGAADMGADGTNTTYYFTIGGQAAASTSYYICVATTSSGSSQRLTVNEGTWYPEIWIEVSTTPLKLTYHQFNTDGIITSYEQVAGSYKALNPTSYIWNNKSLKETWKDNNAYFASWCATAPNGYINKRVGDRIAAGATFQFTTDTDFYPIGAMLENFDTSLEEDQPADTKKILISPYEGGFSYALETNVSSSSGSAGVAFDVPKSLVTNKDLNKRLLYVHQGNSWHLLKGPTKSNRGDGYLTYKLSGRDTNGTKFYNSSTNLYTVRMIMFDEKSIDLKTSSGGWPQETTYADYRNTFSEYTTIPDSDIKGYNSLTSSQYQEFTLPVYKIKLQTFDSGVTDVARAGCASVTSNYWITSADTNTWGSYFVFNETDSFLGLKSNGLYPTSTDYPTDESLRNWVTSSNTGGYIGQETSTIPKNINNSLWQRYNKGNRKSGVASNVYNVVYQKKNIQIKNGTDTFDATIIWVGTTSYIYAKNTSATGKLSRVTSETTVQPKTGFLYWKYNNNQYATLDSLSKAAFADLMNDSAPVIEAVVGDSKGFVYIKDSGNTLSQYYVYVKESDEGKTLKRYTPYKKNQKWSSQLTPLIFNASGVAE